MKQTCFTKTIFATLSQSVPPVSTIVHTHTVEGNDYENKPNLTLINKSWLLEALFKVKDIFINLNKNLVLFDPASLDGQRPYFPAFWTLPLMLNVLTYAYTWYTIRG